MRTPAAGEGGVNAGGDLAGSRSWATSVNSSLKYIDRYTNFGSVTTCVNNTGADISAGAFVAVSNQNFGAVMVAAPHSVLYPSTLDEEVVSGMVLSNATTVYASSPNAADKVGFLVGLVGSPGSAVPPGGLGEVVLQGPVKTGMDTSALPLGMYMVSSNTPGTVVPFASPVTGYAAVDTGLSDSPYVVGQTLSSDADGYMMLFGGMTSLNAFNKHISAKTLGAPAGPFPGPLTPGQLINSVLFFFPGAPAITVLTPDAANYDPFRQGGQVITLINLDVVNPIDISGGVGVQGGGLITTLIGEQTFIQEVLPGPTVTYTRII